MQLQLHAVTACACRHRLSSLSHCYRYGQHSMGREGRVAGGIAYSDSIGLAAFHLRTDSPWCMTWCGMVFGGAGSGLFLAASAASIAGLLAGVDYARVGAGFIANGCKPTPPRVFFVPGGGMIMINVIIVAHVWVAIAGYGFMAFTFAFGAVASVKQSLSREPVTERA